jgi:outer membrane protein assembly factor BamB
LWSGLLLLALGFQLTEAQSATELVASPEPGWPQWRGPRRDGISTERGLSPTWPKDGPPVVWRAEGLGRGYSCPIIVAGRIYLTGDFDNELRVLALDATGHRLWQTANGRAWAGPYPGARACVAYAGGRLFHLNAHGRLACLDAGTGRELWGKELLEAYGGKVPTWGLGECLVADASCVFATPGGTSALMIALEARTGSEIWRTEPLRLAASGAPAADRLAGTAGEIDNAGYASPLLIVRNGKRLLVSASLRHLFAVDAAAGRIEWTQPIPTHYSVIAATPVLVGDAVYVTAPDTDRSGLYEWTDSATAVSAARRWASPLDTCHGGAVLVGDRIYGSWYRVAKGWAAVDALTGRLAGQWADLTMGSVLYADGRLYCLAQDGEVALLKPMPNGTEPAGRFRLVPGRVGDAWTHPVVLDGRLYLRYHESLVCYALR